MQEALHTAMLTLVLVVDQFSWAMSSVIQIPANCCSVSADQSFITIALTLRMLVWVAMVSYTNVNLFHKRVNTYPLLWTQLCVQLVNYDWQGETLQMKAEWRYAWTIGGVLCVMITGETLRLLWCVDNWAPTLKVARRYKDLKRYILTLVSSNRCSSLQWRPLWCWYRTDS